MARPTTEQLIATRDKLIDGADGCMVARGMVNSPPMNQDLLKAQTHLNSLAGELNYVIKKRKIKNAKECSVLIKHIDTVLSYLQTNNKETT